jgi:hypothetical protein
MLITLCEIVNGNSMIGARYMHVRYINRPEDALLNCVRTKSFPKAASDELSSSFDWIEITQIIKDKIVILLQLLWKISILKVKRLWAVKRRVTSITLCEAAAICKIILRGWQQKRDKNYIRRWSFRSHELQKTQEQNSWHKLRMVLMLKCIPRWFYKLFEQLETSWKYTSRN